MDLALSLQKFITISTGPETTDPQFAARLTRALTTIRQALHVYRPGELCLSFNGGKDCTVVLYLVLAVAAGLPTYPAGATLHGVRIVYFQESDEFPEVVEFMNATAAQLGIQIENVGSFQTGLR